MLVCHRTHKRALLLRIFVFN